MGSADPVRPTRSIDDTLFAVSGLEMSSFSLDRVMEASVKEVWAAWEHVLNQMESSFKRR